MLELYQAEDCPYCQKVREALADLGISYIAHNPRTEGEESTEGGDLRNEQTLIELTKLGGEDQIPFLVDHQRGEMLYESDDIIEYLNEHYS